MDKSKAGIISRDGNTHTHKKENYPPLDFKQFVF